MLRILLFKTTLLFSLVLTAQNFNSRKFLEGQWCDKGKIDCFNIIAIDGLLIYETITGDFRTGIEIIGYNDKTETILWELVKTNKKTNSFKILNKNKVEFDNNNRRTTLYRQEKQQFQKALVRQLYLNEITKEVKVQFYVFNYEPDVNSPQVFAGVTST